MASKIIVFTDGSSRGNPGPGGWGAVVLEQKGATGEVCELGGGENNTTNNRMEISAAIGALAFIESKKIVGEIEVHTDSMYLLNGVTGWMYGWEKNGWKTKTGDPVLNQDLWQEIGGLVFRLKQKCQIEWTKVSGHSGLLGNERVDEIATNFADHIQMDLFFGKLADYKKLIGGSLFDKDENASNEKKVKKERNSKPAYSYVSMINGMIAIHKTWAECEARVKGKNAKFKKVFSKDEEVSLIEEWTKNLVGQKN